MSVTGRGFLGQTSLIFDAYITAPSTSTTGADVTFTIAPYSQPLVTGDSISSPAVTSVVLKGAASFLPVAASTTSFTQDVPMFRFEISMVN